MSKKIIAIISLLVVASTSQANEDINLGAYVINADTKQTAFSQHPTRSFIPASNMKLFVAVAALDYLTPTYQYQTTLSQEGDNYSINFSGDPSLTRADLFHLLSKLPKTIKGNLALNNTVFDDKRHAPGGTWDELNVYYAAPTASINLDGNCSRFTVSAGANGSPVTNTAKKNNGFQFSSSAISSTTPGCGLELTSNDKNEYRLSGCMPPNTSLPFAIAIHNPNAYAKKLILTYLKQHKITLKGNITFGRAPTQVNTIATHRSAPLSTLMAHMLKTSDNQYADAFLKTLGHEYFQQQGSWFNGIQAIHKILAQTDINFSQVEMHDAAGESRYNLVTPKQIVALLTYAYRNKTIWPTFKNALAISATDGTLKHRLGNLKGKVYAKTGTLKGTSTLSGYLFDQDSTYIFSIMINGGRQNSSTYWTNEREILESVILT